MNNEITSRVWWSAACLSLAGGLVTANRVLATASPKAPETPAALAQPIRPFWAGRKTGYFKARDGVELHYSVLLPKGKGPFPTLLHYSGYDVGSIGGSEYLAGHTTYPRTIDKQLIDAGYAVIGVNTRATGCSAGDSFDWHRNQYGEDGYDAVEFAASQPWSTGKVGMYSWSWAGMSQLWTASFQPPHLKAIAPGHVIADPRADSYAPGGVPQPTMISDWAATYVPERWEFVKKSALAEGDTRCVAQVDKNLQTLEAGSPGRLVQQHPYKDDYLDERTVARRTKNISVPVLSLTSYQDEATTSRGGYYQWTVNPKLMWMIDTNGGHSMYASEQYRTTMLQFFDHYLKDKSNGFEATPRLQIWEQAKIDPARLRATQEDAIEAAVPSWVVSRPTISPDVSQVAFALGAGGRLLENGASSGTPDTFKYPSPGPAVLVYAGSGGVDDQWDAGQGWRQGSAVYTSAPLAQDLVNFGPASLDFWVSVDGARDLDLQATVTAIDEQGQEQYIQRGWLRLSNRALDKQHSTPGRPVVTDNPADFAPLLPDTPVEARLEINRFSYGFRKGTRLRVWVDTPSVTGLYTFMYDPVPTKVKLWHDQEHPSQLVLNVLPTESVPMVKIEQLRCKEALSEPCRQDPVSK